jgi:hypothetical protein
MKLLDEKILDSLARLFKLLSDPNRMRILFVIGKEKKSVSEIIAETSLSQTLVSFHQGRCGKVHCGDGAERAFITTGLFSVLIDLLISLLGFLKEERCEVNFISHRCGLQR